MGQNIYQTKNYFIGAYHYVQCFGTDLVVPRSTAEVSQALAFHYKRSQVSLWSAPCSSHVLDYRVTPSPASLERFACTSRTSMAHTGSWQPHVSGTPGSRSQTLNETYISSSCMQRCCYPTMAISGLHCRALRCTAGCSGCWCPSSYCPAGWDPCDAAHIKAYVPQQSDLPLP
jgi:hypothetical protein